MREWQILNVTGILLPIEALILKQMYCVTNLARPY